MPSKEASLLQGNLDVLILRALSEGPSHGYGVARWVWDATGGELVVEDRALYIALHRLEERGWVSASWGASENNRRARYYRLSTKGRRALARKQREWSAHAAAMFKALGVKP
ncbi:MAG: PadR family transcriptional regulator [Vicinamibacterales bacterium]